METNPVQHTRVGAYGLVVSDSSILLCRLSSQVKGWAGAWALPGGGLNFGEDPADGMVREVHEETGLNVRPTDVAAVDSVSGELIDRSYHSIRIIYHTELLGGSLAHELDGTTDLCQWFSREEALKQRLVDLVRVALPLVFT